MNKLVLTCIAASTMLTAPCTIFWRALMMASACWRRSITCAISAA